MDDQMLYEDTMFVHMIVTKSQATKSIHYSFSPFNFISTLTPY